MSDNQIVKQLRDNAQAVLDQDLQASGNHIPTAAIAGALQMAADEIERLQALVDSATSAKV